MKPMMEVAVVFSSLNAVLLVVLLAIFVGLAIRTRASHSVGLAFFAALLLANSLVTVYSYAAMAPVFGREALPFLSMMSVLEFIGLAVLLKITL